MLEVVVFCPCDGSNPGIFDKKSSKKSLKKLFLKKSWDKVKFLA